MAQVVRDVFDLPSQKVCNMCAREGDFKPKSYTEFYVIKPRKKGRSPYLSMNCRSCERIRKRRREELPDKVDTELIVPAALFLFQHYGTWKDAAEAADVSVFTLRGLGRRRTERTERSVAEKVVRHALEVRGKVPDAG